MVDVWRATKEWQFSINTYSSEVFCDGVMMKKVVRVRVQGQVLKIVLLDDCGFLPEGESNGGNNSKLSIKTIVQCKVFIYIANFPSNLSKLYDNMHCIGLFILQSVLEM
jgi:hypothetical protein